jgi:hypothetical protein
VGEKKRDPSATRNPADFALTCARTGERRSMKKCTQLGTKGEKPFIIVTLFTLGGFR